MIPGFGKVGEQPITLVVGKDTLDVTVGGESVLAEPAKHGIDWTASPSPPSR